jgi:hypothetical protein
MSKPGTVSKDELSDVIPEDQLAAAAASEEDERHTAPAPRGGPISSD